MRLEKREEGGDRERKGTGGFPSLFLPQSPSNCC